MTSPRATAKLQKRLLITLGATVLALGIGEILLRSLYSEPLFYTWPPGLQRTFQPDPEALPGIEGPSRFLVNTDGFRGDEIPDDGHHILAIGGSTTECLYLDQDETWPQLLAAQLESGSQDSVWIGNAGKSGLRSREHVVQMKFLLPQYPQVDTVILLVGQNDFINRLMAQDQFDPNFMARPDAEQLLIRRTFSKIGGLQAEGGLALGYFFDKLIARFTANPTIHGGEVLDSAGAVIQKWRKKRRDATILETLPDLTPGLVDYQQNLNWVANYADQHEVRLILVTQPTLWRDDLTPAEQALLQSGGKGQFRSQTVTEYYSATALAKGIARYNELLIAFAKESGVEYVDAAAEIPKNATMFYDDVHFTEDGAARLAEVLYRYLSERAPFKE